MDPRAYRVAREFVKAHLRVARYDPEFLQSIDGQRFRNPETGNDVKFLSLPSPEQVRIYQQWRSKQNVQEGGGQQRKQPETRKEITARNLEIARQGTIKDKRVLSSGGRGSGGPVNESFIVKLEHDGQSQIFIHKPAEGEEPHLRIGIPAGQYHAREQAAYTLDSMLGGRGVVPITQTRGADSGSFQLWAQGARPMHGTDMDELVDKVPLEQLSQSPDFERVNVLDLITGHQDRHRGNILFHFDGDESPENLRFVAIDNGLSMGSPTEHRDHAVYVNPFAGWYQEPEGAEQMDPFERAKATEEAAAKAKKSGDKAVAKSLSKLSPQMIEAIQDIDLTDAAKSLTDAGVDEEGAVRATLVRIAALQADPTIFRDILQRHNGDLDEAWRDFQYLSGYKDDLLWRAGAGDDVEEQINNAVARARPKGGWTKPISLEEANKAMQDLDGWGATAAPDDATPRRGGPKDEADFSMLATNVRDRWLIGKATRRGRGRKLTVSRVNPGDRSLEVVGEFELDRNGKVKESYKDYRFRADIRSGIRLMGKRITPKDGARFMGALEKVFGARSMYDVKRT